MAFSTSSQRLGLPPAPGGLCLLQEVVNTEAILPYQVPDLLADPVVAQRWLTQALRVWGEQTGQPRVNLTVNRRDLVALRRLRADLRHWLRTGDMAALEVPVKAVSVGVTAGTPVYGPRGDGTAGLTALIGMELLLAVHAGTAERLRVCMNAECGAAFYDQSRNGSRVWHDVKTCGNVVNLRASRARRKESAAHRDVTSE
ncbi:CGNR zinc finger domain-containing protein [Mycobacterium sp. WMMD1722]|uniref:CGNR zinc finger domain-containing protein n=1 Tax=Mycobacterium sp. WMMD1722 TaxID=3404117 RepID=UPI003BF51D65